MTLSEEMKVSDLFLKLLKIQWVVILSINQRGYKVECGTLERQNQFGSKDSLKCGCVQMKATPGAG